MELVLSMENKLVRICGHFGIQNHIAMLEKVRCWVFWVCVRGENCVIGIWNPRFWIEIWVVKTKVWNYWNIFQLVVGVYLCSREYYNQHAMSSPARCYPKFTFFLQFFFWFRTSTHIEYLRRVKIILSYF